MPDLKDNIQYLKGVGPAFAKKFAKLGITTVQDLLFHYPRRYVDYTKPYAVAEAPYDVDCCVKAEVLQKEPARRIKGGRVLTRVLAADDTGTLVLSWFNAPYVAEHLEPGKSYYFEGRIGGATDPAGDPAPGHPHRGGSRPQPAGAGVSQHRRTAQRPHCQGGGGGAGRCRRPAGAAAAGTADPVPDAAPRPGHPGHSCAPFPRGDGRSPPPADFRGTVYSAAGHFSSAGPWPPQNRCPHAPGGPDALLAQSALCPHRGPAPRHRGNLPGPLRAGPHEPAVAGRCGQRQDAGGSSSHLACSTKRLAKCHAGSHRAAGPPACRQPGRPAGTFRRQCHAAGGAA